MALESTEHSDNCVRGFIGISVCIIPKQSDPIKGIIHIGEGWKLFVDSFRFLFKRPAGLNTFNF